MRKRSFNAVALDDFLTTIIAGILLGLFLIALLAASLVLICGFIILFVAYPIHVIVGLASTMLLAALLPSIFKFFEWLRDQFNEIFPVKEEKQDERPEENQA